MENIRLTQFSHGAGCGCKISPALLGQILHSNQAMPDNKRLLVGNHTRDDAAVYDLGNGTALISTTDFFMPIVDDPYMFGRIAGANAISDVYAMGGKPVLAIAILGWPIQKLPPEIARLVVEGGRSICAEAGISLAGGHSIDSPEPIFGLAVNGLVDIAHIKKNDAALAGDLLFLTKALGVGILTTAEKKGILQSGHASLAAEQMMRLNRIGEQLGALPEVHALTDVTGFGLLGHLTEMAEGSGLSARVSMNNIPLIAPSLPDYVAQQSIPGGTHRNWDSYGKHIGPVTDWQKAVLADPQTSGGLLLAVDRNRTERVKELFRKNGLEAFLEPIGEMLPARDPLIVVE
jgi:selenide,water dikinase